MGRTLYSLKSSVNLERLYVSAIEELKAKEGHNLNINSESLEGSSLKEKIGDLVNMAGACLQSKFNGMTGAFNKARKVAGGVKLTEIRRQERLEYRQTTEAMGHFETHEAIEIYRKLSVFSIKDTAEEAKTSLVTSFAKEYTEQMESLKQDDLIAMRSIAIGAYTNAKVAEFNTKEFAKN